MPEADGKRILSYRLHAANEGDNTSLAPIIPARIGDVSFDIRVDLDGYDQFRFPLWFMDSLPLRDALGSVRPRWVPGKWKDSSPSKDER